MFPLCSCLRYEDDGTYDGSEYYIDMATPLHESDGPLQSTTLSDKVRLAASKGQLQLIQELLRDGASFEQDRDGRTALHYAALNGFTEVCRNLLEQGCPVNTQDASGYTALHRAASQGHLEVIRTIVERGCNVDIQDEHGNAALHEAAWNGFSKTLELLVKHDCDVMVINKAGFSALHLSAQNGHNESTRVLLYAGCNADHKNNYGDTALHTAARYGHAGVTRILISARARLQEQNKNGDTTLHIAAALKRRKIAKLLCEAGVDTQVKNKQNETAMDVARRKEHDEIIVIIQTCMRMKTPKVNFRDDIITEVDGPVVVPDEDLPVKPDKQEKSKKFFFFKKKKTKEKDRPPPHGAVSQQKLTTGGGGASGRSGVPPVKGFFSQYVPRPGNQYYRDLAGNIKQGPIGYTPVCHCMPAIRRLEHEVDHAKDKIYSHIDSNNQIMRDRLDQYDQRASLRVHALEKYTREQFANEETNCQQRIDQAVHGQDPGFASRNDTMKVEIQQWLEDRLSSYGHCLDHHHDDSALPNDNVFFNVHETENGRLFKTRSDETLSQSDNHSGRFRKRDFYESRQAAMQQIRAWQVPSYSKDRQKVQVQSRPSREMTAASRHVEAKVEIRNSSQGLNSKGPNTHSRGTTESSDRNPHVITSEDSHYISMANIQSQRQDFSNEGAIPKRIPQSQSWQNRQGQTPHSGPTQRSSPFIHSTPKSRESSPFNTPPAQTMVRSHTDSGGLSRAGPSSRLAFQNWNKAHENETSQQTSGVRRGPIHQSSPMTRAMHHSSHPSVSSTGNDSPRTPKPTFTTFGYENVRSKNDGRTAPANSPEQTNNDRNESHDKVYVSHSDVTQQRQHNISHGDTSGSTGTKSNSTVHTDEPDSRSLFSPQRQFQTPSRQDSYGSYGFTPTNRDDIYAYRNSNPPVRQRTMSSEGLLDDNVVTSQSFHRSKSEERTLDEIHNSRVQTPVRAVSENRESARFQNARPSSGHMSSQGTQSPCNSSLEQSQNQQGAKYENRPNNSVQYENRGNYSKTSAGGGDIPRSANNSNTYATVQDLHSGDSIQYRGPKPLPPQRTSEGQYNSGSGRDSLYSTVRDVRLKEGGRTFVTQADVHNVNQRNYDNNHNLTGPGNINGKQEGNFSQRPHMMDYQQFNGLNSSAYSRENLCQGSREGSPNVCNNSKEDSSSNPDSGYSSKIYGNRAGSTNPPSSSGTPSSSFSTDRGVSIPSNNPSPQNGMANREYETITSQQYQDSVRNHVQDWYKRRLQEATHRYNDTWKIANSPNRMAPSPIQSSPMSHDSNYEHSPYSRQQQYPQYVSSPYARQVPYTNSQSHYSNMTEQVNYGTRKSYATNV